MTALTYAVTGATGQLGRLAVASLLARQVAPSDIVAVVRDPVRAGGQAARGVQVRGADYDDPGSLRAALIGIDRLLLVSSSAAGERVGHHTNVIEAAQANGVARIAYTSMLNADTTTNPLAEEHRATEQILRGSDVPFTLLRNGWYTENYTGQLAQYLHDHKIVGAAGQGQISAATRADLATAAVNALLDDTTEDCLYELGGNAFTLNALARIISDVTGTPVIYRDLTEHELARHLQAGGMDQATASFVASLDASIARGDLHTDSQDLTRLLGHPAASLTDAIRRTTR